MDRRWAAGAAATAVVLVAGVGLVLASGDMDRGDKVLTQPPAVETSPSMTPRAVGPGSSASPQRTVDPDTPVTSTPEPLGGQPPSREPSAPASDAPPPKTAAPAPAPTTAAPRPSPSASPAARAAFSFDAAYGTDEPYEVVVQYGDSSSCPHQRVTHAVQETADQVVVTLESDAMDQERACTADYRQMLVPVRLKQPLGDRVLVDGSRREPVPVDRSCQRPFANPPPPKDCEP